MAASCIVVKFTRRSLGALCVALVTHAKRLNSLLEPSWPNAEEIQDKMYGLVETLIWYMGWARNGLAHSPELRGRRRC
jgi:hypothetical protein